MRKKWFMVGRLIAAAVEDSSRCYITVGMIAKATFGFVRNVKTNEKGTFSSVFLFVHHRFQSNPNPINK